jgi:CRISPR/Cas system CMR subunit Cmr4 (Cas7 group RAMP superfamily)
MRVRMTKEERNSLVRAGHAWKFAVMPQNSVLIPIREVRRKKSSKIPMSSRSEKLKEGVETIFLRRIFS